MHYTSENPMAFTSTMVGDESPTTTMGHGVEELDELERGRRRWGTFEDTRRGRRWVTKWEELVCCIILGPETRVSVANCT